MTSIADLWLVILAGGVGFVVGLWLGAVLHATLVIKARRDDDTE